jgi:type II secretory pathway component PulC
MSAARLNAVIIVGGAIGLVLAVRLLASPLVGIAVPPRAERTRVAAASPRSMAPDSVGTLVTRHDPFRMTRRPSAAVYDPVQLAQPATPPAPKPALALVGIVWDSGRDPTALLEGLPGVDGPRALRQGETIGGLRVKRINPDRVVITGLDTTWTLTVREPWR